VQQERHYLSALVTKSFALPTKPYSGESEYGLSPFTANEQMPFMK